MYVALVVNYLVLFCTFKVRTKFIFTMDSRRFFTEWISNQIIEWVHAHCRWKLLQLSSFLSKYACQQWFRYLLFYNESVTALFIHDFLRFRNNRTTDTDLCMLLQYFSSYHLQTSVCLMLQVIFLCTFSNIYEKLNFFSTEVNYDARWQAWTWEGGTRKKRKASANGISESWEGSQEKCWD